MPNRPPKQWMHDCIEGVKESGSAYDPAAVCGSTWFHKLSKKDRERITREAEKHSKRRKR